MINLQHVTLTRDGSAVLDDVSLSIDTNKIFGIVSSDICASSALLEVLAGVVAPSGGSVTLGGQHDVAKDSKKAKALVGYMPKDMPLYCNMTVIEYLTFIADAKGLSYIDAQKSVKSALESVELLSARNILISRLNKAARVRLALGQAVASCPPILLLDDPTGSLSGADAEKILGLIKTLSRNKIVLMATSDTRALAVCDNTVALSCGRINHDESCEEVG